MNNSERISSRTPAATPKRRFRNRVLLYLLLLSMPPLLIWGYFAYTRSLEFVSNFYERELLASAKEIALRVQWAQRENMTFARYLALEIENSPRSSWQRLLTHMGQAEPMFFNIHLIGPDGMNIARSDGKPLTKYADRSYFKTAMEGEGSHELLLSRVYDQRPTICTSSPIRKKDRSVIAVLGVCRFLNKELLQLSALKLGRTSHLFMADGIKHFSVYPEFKMRTDAPTEIEAKALSSSSLRSDGRLDFEAAGDSYVGFHIPLGNTWQLIAIQEKTELTMEAQQLIATPTLIGLLSLLAALFAGVIVIDRSTHPLLKLTAAAEGLGPSNLQIRVPVESQDEIGILAGAFNSMADRLHDAFARLRENEILLNQSNDELERKITRQSQKLAYSTKMSSLGEMAGSIAHEVNNPLAIISLRTQKLRQQIENGDIDKDQILETLDKIESTCIRINQIVRGLRAFSRDGSQDPMVLENLSSVVHDAIALCTETARNRGIEIRSNCPESIEIECQPVQIGQVLLNLLNNARDAAELQQNKRLIEVVCTVEGRAAIVRITDSGRGVPPELYDKIMQPFFTTKKFGKGTGLGLSISKGILEQHHGELTLDTSSKQTCFVMRLPLRQPRA